MSPKQQKILRSAYASQRAKSRFRNAALAVQQTPKSTPTPKRTVRFNNRSPTVIPNRNNANNANRDERMCWTPVVIGLVGLYILICSSLYVTGAISIREGPGLELLAANLIMMCIFIALVFAFPWKVGCDM